MYTSTFEEFWPTFPPELKQQIKDNMLLCIREPNPVIRKKMCECTAEFARNMMGRFSTLTCHTLKKRNISIKNCVTFISLLRFETTCCPFKISYKIHITLDIEIKTKLKFFNRYLSELTHKLIWKHFWLDENKQELSCFCSKIQNTWLLWIWIFIALFTCLISTM